MLLVHGFTDTWRTWAPVLDRLEAHHDVIAVNLPGHLGSPDWDRSVPLSATTATDVVAAVLDDLGVARAHLVGNSLGGWLSLELGARGRGLSVVALCPAGGWEPGSREQRAVARFFRANGHLLRLGSPLFGLVAGQPLLRRLALRQLVARPGALPADAALAMLRGARACTLVDAALALLDSGEAFGELGPIDCPVRILYGTADGLLRYPGHYRRLRRLLPGADWVALDGLAHLPMWDDAEVTADAILAVTCPGPITPGPVRSLSPDGPSAGRARLAPG